MSEFADIPIEQIQFDRLNLCRVCGRIYGEIVYLNNEAASLRRQRCECEPVEEAAQPQPQEAPEVVTLCRCCGRRPVLSGKLWSIWFCDTCRRAVEQINRIGRCHVIPVGRHTLLDQIGRAEDGDNEVPPFVTALGDWFARAERLEIHAWLVVQGNLRELARGTQVELALVDYLERLPASAGFIRAAVRDLGRAFDLPPCIIAEAMADIE